MAASSSARPTWTRKSALLRRLVQKCLPSFCLRMSRPARERRKSGRSCDAINLRGHGIVGWRWFGTSGVFFCGGLTGDRRDGLPNGSLADLDSRCRRIDGNVCSGPRYRSGHARVRVGRRCEMIRKRPQSAGRDCGKKYGIIFDLVDFGGPRAQLQIGFVRRALSSRSRPLRP